MTRYWHFGRALKDTSVLVPVIFLSWMYPALSASVSQVVVTPFAQALASGVAAPVVVETIPAACSPLPGGRFPLTCEIGKRTKDVRAFIVATPAPVLSADDAVVFRRAGPESSTLQRRDLTLGDPASGTELMPDAVGGKPSVSGDGTLSVVAGGNLDGCFSLTTRTNEVACLRLPESIWAAAVSPDARRFAYVVCGEPTANPPAFPGTCTATKDRISVVDVVSREVRTFSVLPSPVTDAIINSIDLVEGMSFSSDGAFLIFDARSQVQVSGGPLQSQWAIYGLDLEANKTFVLIPAVPGFDLRWPSLAHGSDDFMVMDVYDHATYTDHVVAVRLGTGKTSIVASDGPRCCVQVQSGVRLPEDLPLYGMPSYNGNDSAVVFSATDVSELYGGLPGGVPTKTSLQTRPVAADRMTPVGGPWIRTTAALSIPWLADGAAGAVYRPGPWPRVFDNDGDGVPDTEDNCLAYPNGPGQPDAGAHSQLDTNEDGYGNSCDADINGDGFVNYADLARFRSAFGTSDPDADFDGDGIVNFTDLARFRQLFGKPPGPSAIAP